LDSFLPLFLYGYWHWFVGHKTIFNIQTLPRTIYLIHWLWKIYWIHWGSDLLQKKNDSRKNVRYSDL